MWWTCDCGDNGVDYGLNKGCNSSRHGYLIGIHAYQGNMQMHTCASVMDIRGKLPMQVAPFTLPSASLKPLQQPMNFCAKCKIFDEKMSSMLLKIISR